MPMLFFAIVAVLAWALQSLLFAYDWTQEQGVQADAEAVSFLASHQAAADWAARHGHPSGPIVPGPGMFPLGYTVRPQWRHEIVDGRLFSYTSIDYVQPPGFADVVGTVGSSACLRAGNGTNNANCPTGTVVLPAGVASAVRAGAVMIVGG